jgi:hypothetical protein
MSGFPKGGDVVAMRAWLDEKGFNGLLNGWDADALMGQDNADDLIRALGNNEGEGLRLWCLLNTARQTPSPGKEIYFPVTLFIPSASFPLTKNFIVNDFLL